MLNKFKEHGLLFVPNNKYKGVRNCGSILLLSLDWGTAFEG